MRHFMTNSIVLLIALQQVTLAFALSSSSTTKTTPSQQQQKWKPKILNLEERRKLRGKGHSSETIGTVGFHHVEFYCGDAKSTSLRFSLALGMPVTGVTGQATGNDKCISYGLVSGDVRLLLTAPYSQQCMSSTDNNNDDASTTTTTTTAPASLAAAVAPLPSFDAGKAHDFFQKHGLAAKAVGLEVKCAKTAFDAAVQNGATPVLEPTFVETCEGQKQKGVSSKGCMMSEVELYGDVVLRFLSFEGKQDKNNNDDATSTSLPFLPHLAPMEGKISQRKTYGIRRMDHAVGNVADLYEAHERIAKFTGFHEFAEFTSEDVGTVDSGLNSVVLASDSENVLLPLNEPTEGKRKSQIKTYLEQNEGSGLQHLALKTDDIFETIQSMRIAEEDFGGFELMKRPSDEYYRELPDRLGDALTEEQYKKLENLGILADADDEGILLQIFTKPIGDRPTFFFEIIQRIGCKYTPEGSEEQLERPGCGGFGQGNFRELFKAIEDHEKTLKV